MVRTLVRPSNRRDENFRVTTSVKLIMRLCSPKSLHVNIDAQLHFTGQLSGGCWVVGFGATAMVGTAAVIVVNTTRRNTSTNFGDIFLMLLIAAILISRICQSTYNLCWWFTLLTIIRYDKTRSAIADRLRVVLEANQSDEIN